MEAQARPQGRGSSAQPLLRGVMVSQIWPDACDYTGATAEAIRAVLDVGVFEAIQSVHVDASAEREQVRRLVEESGITYTYCLARDLGTRRLNLSSLDPGVRRQSLETAKAGIDRGRECGASRISFVSGPRPEELGRRGEALKALEASLFSLAEYASAEPEVTLVLEPLDWKSHKNGTLGTVTEGIALCGSLEEAGYPLTLCTDTSHMLLNGEDPVAETAGASRFLSELHFCNPVLDRDHPLFGDRHIQFGAPGALAVEDLGVMLGGIVDQQQFRPRGPVSVSLEVMNTPREDSEASLWLLDYNRRVIEEIFAALEARPGAGNPPNRGSLL